LGFPESPRSCSEFQQHDLFGLRHAGFSVTFGTRSSKAPFADAMRPGERNMKSGTTDQAEGKLHEVKGKLKEALGHVSNDPDLEAEGKDENLSGKIQKKIGQIKEVFEN
jgi:uncharacterized protein YjbJ (UPF0337 family)